MAKRFTETEKWKDPWFFELPNDARIVWLYLLDECDNAGIWQCSIKRLNFNCNTNFTEDDLLKYFSERLVKISSDRFLIKKFCEYQYGFNFMKSKNKAVVSAIDKLKNYNLIIEDSNGNYTLSIPYLYPMDTPKDKEKDIDKVQDKNQDKEQVKEQVKNIMAEFDKHFAEL